MSHDPYNRITNIKWSLNDAPIEDIYEIGIDKSLNIANVRKKHSGIYRLVKTSVFEIEYKISTKAR